MDRETWADAAVFAAIAEAGSFTRAGVRLGVSASALSHRMRAMEARLGVRLLNRTTRSVKPTEAGERLLTSLRPAIRDLDEALAALGADRERPAGRVRVTTHRSAAFDLVLPRLPRIAETYPDIRVEIVIDDGLADIVAQGFDAGIRRRPSLEQDMISVRLDDGVPLRMVASPSYLATFGTPGTPREVLGHRCLSYRLPTAGSLYPWTFERNGETYSIEPPQTFLTNDIDMLCEAARAGLGLAWITAAQAAPHLTSGMLVGVLEDWCPHLPPNYLYYAGRRHLPAPLRAFIDAIKVS
jgi:DNA-binding transcriptional LysR family regulator